ncbi:hypothetical protein AB0939_17700 [Streptomyces sp. NPDC006990]|uniref:hypothetical protein n=1 Tax=Streptomyces sp. NPDC006990 TaxID=3154481 RepID=UPI003455FB72
MAFGLANAGVTGIIAPEVDLTVDGMTITTIGGYDSINTLVTRFAAGGTTLTAAELTSRLAGVAFLRRGARVLLPPAPLTIDVVLPGKPPLSDTTLPFPLTVALRLARPRVLVSPEFRTQGSSPHTVEQAEAPVPPYVTGAGSPQQASLTLESFERSFRNAFPELRLATGHAPEGGTDLSVVSFAEGGITDVRLMPGQAWQGASTRKAPRVFALRPLSRELVSRVGVPVRLLSPEGTLARDATPMDFLGVDVEVWARRLLTDIDLFLTAAYATAVRNDQGTGDALARVIAAKRTLAGAVARGLWPVLDAADPDAQAERDAREAAVEQLAGELAVGLSDGYGTTALVQYDVHVAPPSNCVAGRPARLHGTVASSPGASYSLSSSGIDLSRPVSRTGFLLRLSDPRWQSNVDIDIDYEVLDLEYEIRAEPQVGGYEAGRWLAFRPPLSGDRKPAALQVTPGRAQVPVPLRAYPAPPVLLGQAAGASAAGPSSGAEPLSGAPLWTYSVTYTHEHAAQDEVWVTVAFNVSAEAALSGTGDDDVVSALAAYGCVAEGLWSHLAGYVSGAGTPAARANAAVAFGELVERAAEAWDRRWPLRAEDPPVPGPAGPSAATARGPGHVEATLRVHVGHLSDEGGTWLDAVELTALADGPGPGGTWPEVEYLDMEGHAVRLVPDTPVGSSRTYRCTPRVPTSGRPRLRLHWPNLHVMSYQNARAALSVCRNSRLVPDGPPTDEQFVFRTAPAVAPDVVTPFLVWDTPVDISAAGSIEEALSATFATFTGASGSPSAVVSIDYGFELVAGEAEGQGLVSRLPIALAPLDMTPTAATTVARVASDWLLDNDPPSARGGMLIFSIKLFSPLSQGTRQPLLWMSQLVYRLS